MCMLVVTLSLTPGCINLFGKQARKFVSYIIKELRMGLYIQLAPAATPIRCNSWVFIFIAFTSFSGRN
jgi:hypothetical protein